MIGGAEDELNIPSHHLTFVFRSNPDHLYGAVINRVNGAETRLASTLFDGTKLELQLPNQTAPGYLRVVPVGEKFEGFWMKSDSEQMGVKLKLVRAK